MSGNDTPPGTPKTEDPSDPGWAGNRSGEYWMFTRQGRWHVHDAVTGEPLGVIPLYEPLNIQYEDPETSLSEEVTDD